MKIIEEIKIGSPAIEIKKVEREAKSPHRMISRTILKLLQ